MNIHLKIPRPLYQQMLADLARPHSFAYERIGFCRVRIGNVVGATKYALVTHYWPVPDEQYIPDEFSGARIDNVAIRGALQESMNSGEGIFHVHLHDFPGYPRFSIMDLREIPRIVESLTYANGDVPHGMLVFSHEGAAARAIFPGGTLQPVERITVVGQPTLVLSELPDFDGGERFDRQGFLGPLAPKRINSLRIGVVGLSGGGSHIVQQLSHVGFADFVLFDDQAIDISNLNRLVGATEEDVAEGRLKIAIADRVITSINSQAKTNPIAARWQENVGALRNCDIVVGCVDGFDERRQLEAACRRFLIPLVDIGMDVVQIPGHAPRMAGQVILSLPGYPCFQCIGFLNERTLAAEAQKYGDAGHNPQVVWPNGVLASTAVGIVVDLATGWKRTAPGLIYKSYEGNTDTLTDHPCYEYVRGKKCLHYRLEQIGDP